MFSKSLLEGTVVLAVSSILTRFIGLAFKMLLSRVIGPEGLGLLQMVLPLYSIAGVFASLGIPGALAQRISRYHFIEKYFFEHSLKRFALSIAIISSLLISGVIFFLLPFFVHLFPDQRIFLPLRLIPLALIFAAPAAVYKGYFQGHQNMYPTAFSMLGEQLARTFLGIAGVILMLPYGLEFAILGIVFGIIIGELTGLQILTYFLKKTQQPPLLSGDQKSPLSLSEKKGLISLAAPLLFIRLSGSLSHAIESVLLPYRLQTAGFSSSHATALYGKLIGMAFPLLFLSSVVLIPFTINLLPQISKAAGNKKTQKLKQSITFASWITLLLGLLTSFFLYFFSMPLTSILFASPETAPLVRSLSLSAPFAFLQFVSATILHGLGLPGKALQHDLMGTFITLLLLYILAADAAIGIFAAGPAYTLGFAFTTFLNYRFIFVWQKNSVSKV